MIPKNMNEIMRQAQKMQTKMNQLQDEMGKKEITASAGGGMVEATVNGQGNLIRIHIERDVVDPEDREMLGDLIVAAVSEAQRQAKETMQQEINSITGGLNLPGLF